MREGQCDDLPMQGGKKELLTAAAPALIAGVLGQYGQVRLRAYGSSMFPVIRSGDVLCIRHCTAETVQQGDVVLMRNGDRVVAHRLIDKQRHDGESFLVTRGDSLWCSDPARSASMLLGRVVAVVRNGRALDRPLSTTLRQRLYGLTASESTRLSRRIRSLIASLAAPALRTAIGSANSKG